MPPLEPSTAPGSLLVPGRNCWRIERARRVAFLVDGEAYFGAIRAALASARHSIIILGWDIDSRMRLVPSGANDGWPEPLGEFLDSIVRARRRLRAYVLSWDFAMLYLMEREWLPIYKLDWKTSRRLSFRLDDRHPAGASHHQKIVVVDDALAFVSGFDLTRCRWDTPEHACDHPLRRDSSGTPYPPFHDVGVMVDGDCARALGDLARTRWQRATGRRPRASRDLPGHDPWPQAVAPDIEDVRLGIARTEPRMGAHEAVGEIKALHEDAIGAARQHVFCENQYFTSRTIAAAFARRLAAPGAPEVGIVSPYRQSGWLEVSTMGVLRARIHRELQAADAGRRYRLYCPTLPWLDHGKECLNIHSKVLEIDGRFLTIGSANLSERSMGLDTECNLVLEAGGEARIAAAIASLRNRLLGEHLGVPESEVAAAWDRTGSLHATLDALRRADARTLAPFEPDLDPALDAIVPSSNVIDPEVPIDPDLLVADLVPHEETRVVPRTRIVVIALAVIVLAALAFAWRATPLREYVNLDTLVALAERLQDQPLAPLVVVATYAVASLAMVPVMLLIAVTAIVFGPVLGLVYAFMGAMVGAACGYALGRALGRDTVRRLAGTRVNRLSRELARRGVLAVALVRVLPVAPFTVVNVVAGASHIGWRDFLLGSLLGFTPGIVLATLFIDRALDAARHPGPSTYALLAAVALLAFGLIGWLRRRLAPVDVPQPEGGHVG